MDDKVYVANEDGEIAIFRLSADPRVAMKLIDNDLYPVNANQDGDLVYLKASIFASPIFANGTLFIASRTHLFAIATLPEKSKRPPGSKTNNDKKTSSKKRTGLRSAFVPTPQSVVDKMLEVSQIKSTDMVVDLGSGDGRIVLTAAKRYGCRATGYEIERELVEKSRRKAETMGVAEQVRFERADLFTADLSEAHVITVYLLPNQLKLLIPQFQKLQPGSRIISHHFEIPGIKPDKTIQMNSESEDRTYQIHLWITPLKAP